MTRQKKVKRNEKGKTKEEKGNRGEKYIRDKEEENEP